MSSSAETAHERRWEIDLFPPSRRTRSRTIQRLVLIAAVALISGPWLLRRGYVLSYDMVFVPDPPISSRMLGLDGSVPRAVPSDLIVALLATALPADLVQKALLTLILIACAFGALRLAGTLGASPAAATVAGMVYLWNPYTAERLVVGHWALLLGYAALPWAIEAAIRLRHDDSASPASIGPGYTSRARAQLAVATVVAGIGGGNAMALGVGAVVLVLVWPRPLPSSAGGGPTPGRRPARLLAGYLALAIALSLPWVVPTLVRPGGTPSDVAGVDAFAARADTPAGLLVSLITLGGFWNRGVVPPERHSMLVTIVALGCVVLAVSLAWRAMWRGPGAPLLIAGLLGLVLSAASNTPLLARGFRFIVVAAPGGGILRDSQKFLAAWVLLVAVAGAFVVDVLGRSLHAKGAQAAAVAVLGGAVLAPIALLPSLAWGASARLEPSTFPSSWAAARTAMDSDPEPGAVVLLPWGPYRQFAWNDMRVSLDPAQRITTRPVILDDSLPLVDRVVAGEDPGSRLVAEVLARGPHTTGSLDDDLVAIGVRYVLFHRGAPLITELPIQLRSPCLVCTQDLRLYRLEPSAPVASTESEQGQPVSAARTELNGWRRGAVWCGWLAFWCAMGVALVQLSSAARTRVISSGYGE